MKKIKNITSHLLGCMLLVSVLSACGPEEETVKLLYTVDEPNGQVSQTFKEVIERTYPHIKVELVIGEGSLANLDSLQQGKADLTIIENHNAFRKNIHSLFPIYAQILHIFYQSEDEVTSFEELIKGSKVFIGLPGSATYGFMKQLFSYFKIKESEYTIAESLFEQGIVICGFTDIIKEENLSDFQGYRLFSFGGVDDFGKGSLADGIALRHPQVRPFVIPKNTYQELSSKPIVTIASDAVLVCSGKMKQSLVHDITKTVFRDQQEFFDISPLIYVDLKEDFHREKLNFPLHEGSREYLDRDEPTFVERYAEVIALSFSILVGLYSALKSLSKWNSQRKKDRVDIFYNDLIEVKNEIDHITSFDVAVAKIRHIKDSQNKAFAMLIDEKLKADESFRIYMELSKETVNELYLKARRLKKNITSDM